MRAIILMTTLAIATNAYANDPCWEITESESCLDLLGAWANWPEYGCKECDESHNCNDRLGRITVPQQFWNSAGSLAEQLLDAGEGKAEVNFELLSCVSEIECPSSCVQGAFGWSCDLFGSTHLSDNYIYADSVFGDACEILEN